MSTSDPTGGSPFDVEQLTRLASEMFRRLDAPAAPSLPSEKSLPAMPVVAPTGAAPLPSSRSIVSESPADRALTRDVTRPASLPGAETLNGAVPRIASPTPPRTSSSSYYFLDHARPGASSGAALSSGIHAPTTDSLSPNVGSSWSRSPATSVGSPFANSALAGSSSAFPGASHLRPAVFDVARIRRDFPILSEKVNGKPLVWLDNAATTQKPQAVIDRLAYFYAHENSNIHRAAHELAARATDAYEGAREKVRAFLNAGSTNEIVFTRGATEAINLVASAWGSGHIRAGDEIVVSHLEHHANIVPWQILAEEKGARIRVIPVDDDGQVILEEFGRLLGPRTKLVSFTQVSNALGTVTPAQQMVAMAHAVGAIVLVDGAQAVSHMPVDVRQLDADFYVFSGHKVFGPTGIGALYGKEDLLNRLEPYQGGGNMIRDVTFESTQYHDAPARFEAGTGNIADAVGLGAAIDYVMKIGMHVIEAYEHELLAYGTNLLEQIPGLHLVGTAPHKAGVLSFVLDGFRTDEVSTALNEDGIAVRGGHHCAQPILRRFGHESTVRPSLAFYNDCSDLDALARAVLRISETRGRTR